MASAVMNIYYLYGCYKVVFDCRLTITSYLVYSVSDVMQHKRYMTCDCLVGLGFKGDIVTVSKRLARNHMFPAGVAEYVTEENLKKYEHIQQVGFDASEYVALESVFVTNRFISMLFLI